MFESALIEQALTSQRQLPWLAIILVDMAIILGGSFLAFTLAQRLYARIVPGGTQDPVRFVFVFFMPLLILFGTCIILPLFTWVHFFEQRPITTLGLPADAGLARFATGFATGTTVVSLIVLLMSLTEAWRPAWGDVRQRPFISLFIAGVFFLGIILQASAEELVFRGHLLPSLGAQGQVLPGIIISALAFAALHLLNSGINPIGLFNLALFGVFTALWALASGTVWEVSGFHTAWNWTFAILFGMSGQAPVTLLRFERNDARPGWLTGSTFGLEGSLITSLALAGLIALLIASNS